MYQQARFCGACGSRMDRWRHEWVCLACHGSGDRRDLIERILALDRLRGGITLEQWQEENEQMRRNLKDNTFAYHSSDEVAGEAIDKWDVYSPYDRFKGAGCLKGHWRTGPIYRKE